MGQTPSKAESRTGGLRPPHPIQTNMPPSARGPVLALPINPPRKDSPDLSLRTPNTKTNGPVPQGSIDRGGNLDIPSPGVSLDNHISPDGNTVIGTEEVRGMSYSESWDANNQHDDGQLPFEQRVIRDKTLLKITSNTLIGILKNATLGSLTSHQHEELFSSQVSLDEPYRLIFYHWEKIESNAHEDVKDLLSFIKKNCRGTFEKFQELQSGTCTEISFKDLWLLYHPGETILRKDEDGWRAYKVERVELQNHSTSSSMLISAYYLDFDISGQWLVPHLEVLTVYSYSGDRVIGNLEIIPSWYFRKHRNSNLLDKLVHRGKEYESHRGKVSYRNYNGDAWPRTTRRDAVRVMIDYVTSSKHVPDTNLLARSFHRPVCSICIGSDVKLPSFPKNAPHDPDLCTQSSSKESRQADERDSEEGYPWLYCPSGIWAFSLTHKTWQRIMHQNLSILPVKDKAFDLLWMNQGHQYDLDILVSAYKNNKLGNRNPDIIEGKGRGLNILLHGGPGTGKGMTVESLSEKHGCPLYEITCGELGAEPELLEKRLHEIFLRASNWGAILLLDDVDIFLEARGPHDLRRNILVSIFLRILEYSDGFLFMTTNRPQKLDLALESHIHMSIQFKDFDPLAQKSIWLNFIREIEGLSDMQKKQLESFVENGGVEDCGCTSMNGRQIRNCMSAALALAQAQDRNLSPDHIKKMLLLGKEFTEFMFKHSTQVREHRTMFSERLQVGIRKQALGPLAKS